MLRAAIGAPTASGNPLSPETVKLISVYKQSFFKTRTK